MFLFQDSTDASIFLFMIFLFVWSTIAWSWYLDQEAAHYSPKWFLCLDY